MDQALTDALNRHSDLLERQIRLSLDWRITLRNALIAGAGGIVGAALVGTLLIAILKPFQSISPLKPTLDRIASALEKHP
jgi:hypothetical protein